MKRPTSAATADHEKTGAAAAPDSGCDTAPDTGADSGSHSAPDSESGTRPEVRSDGGTRAEVRVRGESAAEFDQREAARRQAQEDEERIGNVRQEDIEPYTGLRWVGTVFKAAAVFLLVALVGESIAALRSAGWGVLPVLLGELAQTFVLAVVLWGGGDLVRLLVDMGHDLRAQRILLTRVDYRSRRPDED